MEKSSQFDLVDLVSDKQMQDLKERYLYAPKGRKKDRWRELVNATNEMLKQSIKKGKKQ